MSEYPFKIFLGKQGINSFDSWEREEEREISEYKVTIRKTNSDVELQSRLTTVTHRVMYFKIVRSRISNGLTYKEMVNV